MVPLLEVVVWNVTSFILSSGSDGCGENNKESHQTTMERIENRYKASSSGCRSFAGCHGDLFLVSCFLSILEFLGGFLFRGGDTISSTPFDDDARLEQVCRKCSHKN